MPLSSGDYKKQYLITDSTDIALVSQILPSQSNIGAAFNANIPANGFIQLAGFSGRILNTAAGGCKTNFGIRISAVNYWFSKNNDNGVITIADSGTIPAATYKEYVGAINDNVNGAPILRTGADILDVNSNAIPTGMQSIQFIMAWTQSTATLKGTLKQTRINLNIYEAS